ncbi:hypothetical protein J3F84DRAFT_80567 [Trichoderma pleuroticola]
MTITLPSKRNALHLQDTPVSLPLFNLVSSLLQPHKSIKHPQTQHSSHQIFTPHPIPHSIFFLFFPPSSSSSSCIFLHIFTFFSSPSLSGSSCKVQCKLHKAHLVWDSIVSTNLQVNKIRHGFAPKSPIQPHALLRLSHAFILVIILTLIIPLHTTHI